MDIHQVRAELIETVESYMPACFETYAKQIDGGPLEICRLIVDLEGDTDCVALTKAASEDGFICFYHSDEGRGWFKDHEDILNREWRRIVTRQMRMFNDIAFISGHLDLTQEEFDLHYRPRIHDAVLLGHDFVVGDARGADDMAQRFLSTHKCKPRFIVYHMFDSPRHNAGKHTEGGFQSDDERDAKMTSVSQYDIAWVRGGREKSGTAKNISRRNN